MIYRELIEGQNNESSIFSWYLLQSNNADYQRILRFVMDMADKEIPEQLMIKIRSLSYP